MDRYIVKVPRPGTSTDSPEKPEKRYKQATIKSLKGVVVIERILHLKSILKVENQSTEALLEALGELGKKIPPRDVLKTSKLGHAINRLITHQDPEVARLAAALVKEWKKHFKAKLDRPMIEVRCDRKTEQLREAGRKLLTKSFKGEETRGMAEAIERETFHKHNHLINKAYRRSMRTMVFTLEHQPDIRKRITSGSMSIPDFVSAYKKELKVS